MTSFPLTELLVLAADQLLLFLAATGFVLSGVAVLVAMTQWSRKQWLGSVLRAAEHDNYLQPQTETKRQNHTKRA